MAWGMPGLTKLQYISNGTTAWGASGLPVPVALQQIGILRSLRLLQNGSPTYTGTTYNAALGPWNAFSQLSLTSNQQAPIFRLSGNGAYYVSLLKRGLEGRGGAPDVPDMSESNHTDTSYAYNFPANALAAAPANQQILFPLDLPVAQRVKSLGGDIGMFILQNPNIQLQFAFTTSSGTSASPYTVSNTTTGPNAQMWYVSSNTGNSVTLTSPQVDLVKEQYEAVQNAQDYPNLEWVSQWLEEPFQSAVGGASTITWTKLPVAGLLCRVMAWVIDGNHLAEGTTPECGVRTNLLTASNAVTLTYNTGTTKFAETGQEAVVRQRKQLGFDMPQGVFFYDLLGGEDLNLSDILNTARVPNIQFQMNLSSALGASNSQAKMIYQTLLPVSFR